MHTLCYRVVPENNPYFRLHLPLVLEFLVPPEGSSLNWDEIMIVGLFFYSPSDLTTATRCSHHTRNCVTAITGSCDSVSFESLRIFAISWSSLLKCKLYVMVADLTYTLIPPVERWCLRQRWKEYQNDKENWRIAPAIRCIETSVNNTIEFYYCWSQRLISSHIEMPLESSGWR